MTVKELIAELGNYPSEMRVGFVDYFGNLLEIRDWQIMLRRLNFLTSDEEAILEIYSPDLGEEPD